MLQVHCEELNLDAQTNQIATPIATINLMPLLFFQDDNGEVGVKLIVDVERAQKYV